MAVFLISMLGLMFLTFAFAGPGGKFVSEPNTPILVFAICTFFLALVIGTRIDGVSIDLNAGRVTDEVGWKPFLKTTGHGLDEFKKLVLDYTAGGAIDCVLRLERADGTTLDLCSSNSSGIEALALKAYLASRLPLVRTERYQENFALTELALAPPASQEPDGKAITCNVNQTQSSAAGCLLTIGILLGIGFVVLGADKDSTSRGIAFSMCGSLIAFGAVILLIKKQLSIDPNSKLITWTSGFAGTMNTQDWPFSDARHLVMHITKTSKGSIIYLTYVEMSEGVRMLLTSDMNDPRPLTSRVAQMLGVKVYATSQYLKVSKSSL